MAKPMPAIFFGHCNPMEALLSNAYTTGWAAIGSGIPRPKAVLAVSAFPSEPGTARPRDSETEEPHERR